MGSTRRRLSAITVAAIVLALATAAPAAAKAPERRAPSVHVVMTSANLSWRLSRLPDLRFGDDEPSGVPIVTVDDGIRYQRFTGVGGAMTDSSAWLIYDELSAGA